jgi:hypothetical protein
MPMADGVLTFQIFPVVALKEGAWKLPLKPLRRQRRPMRGGLSRKAYRFRIHRPMWKFDTTVTAGRLSVRLIGLEPSRVW